MVRVIATIALLSCLWTPNLHAQSADTSSFPHSANAYPSVSVSVAKSDAPAHVDGPVEGSNEWLAWVGGGFPFKFFSDDPEAHILTVGGTYGRVLTDAHGPGFLRGRLEWGCEVVPVIEVWLPHYPVHGGGITPFLWKWNFVARRRVTPYLEISGGAVFSDRPIVPRSNQFNFTPSGALGVTLPWGSTKYSWTADVRFYHISNGGITTYNPGLNTVTVRLGFGFFSHPQ